jgi:nucleoside-diphosphate-sugar epimerase
LVCRMLGDGMAVRGTYRRDAPVIPGVDWCPVTQLERLEQWNDLVADIDAVVHLAALAHQMGAAGAGRWPEFRRINVDGTRVLARACRSAGVRRLIFMSSIAAVCSESSDAVNERTAALPQDDYGRSKFEAEDALKSELMESVTDWCILRPPLVYGPNNPGNMGRLLKLIGSGVPLPFGSIRNRRSLIFVDNLVDAVLTVLRTPSEVRETYVLSDGNDFSTPELISALAAVTERRARLVNVPVGFLKWFGYAGDALQRILGVYTGVDSYSIERLVGSLVVDGSLFRDTFDWRPPVGRLRALELTCRALSPDDIKHA